MKLVVRWLTDREIVHEVPLGLKPPERTILMTTRGMLRNLNTKEYFVEEIMEEGDRC